MKIYLASSWKNREDVLKMAEFLRSEGHLVDAFCDGENRVSFDWSELFGIMDREGCDITELDAKDMMNHWRVQEAFKEDKKYLDWSDVVVMLMPCGRSAHLEAGYAVGCGKKLYIVGGFEKGEFDVMYGFADGMFDYSEMRDLLIELKSHAP